MTPERVSAEALVLRLDRLRRGRTPAVLAFDGDGTLWSGDVAEDVFHWAIERELLTGVPAAPLVAIARAHGLTLSGSSNEVAAGLFTAYVAGTFPERAVCEIMAWCFAGHALGDLRRFARQALDDTGLDARVTRALAPVVDWAKNQRVRMVIISASPRFIVEEAARRWDVGPHDIAATTPAIESGRMLPRLATPVPYGPTKVVFGRELFQDSAWLASFGDSPFDLDMLGAAELAVAVRPKPALLEALPALPRSVVLGE
ncbi:MAG: haloacid dehalogenase-like hydrolase [Polyangiaceae bacterium]|nr:haloacid dehalogenase-like hydrolase [Polyangiaceae bacterium]